MRSRPEPRRGRGLAVVASLWAIAAFSFFTLAPTEQERSFTSTVSNAGGVVSRSSHAERTLLDEEGPGVLIPLGIPIVITAVALASSRTRHARSVSGAAAFLMWVFTILGAMSIGYVYLPAAVALTLASRRFERTRRAALVPPAPPPPG